MAVSLTDTIVDRILFGWLGRNVLSTCARTPCAVGWSPVRGGWRDIVKQYVGEDVVALDKEAWDWTVQGWLVDMWKEIIKTLAFQHADWWSDMVDVRFEMLFSRAVFQFQDGTQVLQETEGIMKSGCYLTIILNSLSQSLLHYVASVRIGRNPDLDQPKCMGDDTIQKWFPRFDDYVEQIERLGAIVKPYEVRKWVEFAGFVFDEKCWPAYWQKHLFNLAHSDNLAETIHDYQYLYVHEPVMTNFLRLVAAELGPEHVMPRQIALDLMDFPQ